jgi:hypothetical protein
MSDEAKRVRLELGTATPDFVEWRMLETQRKAPAVGLDEAMAGLACACVALARSRVADLRAELARMEAVEATARAQALALLKPLDGETRAAVCEAYEFSEGKRL